LKTEVYSWRVSSDLKTGLEREARRRQTSVAAVIDLATRDWLKKSSAELDGEAEQIRLRKAALRSIGTLASGNTHRSEEARQAVRDGLRRRHGR
jgi:hypothetical protein